MSLGITFQNNGVTEGRADQLVRYPEHRGTATAEVIDWLINFNY